MRKCPTRFCYGTCSRSASCAAALLLDRGWIDDTGSSSRMEATEKGGKSLFRQLGELRGELQTLLGILHIAASGYALYDTSAEKIAAARHLLENVTRIPIIIEPRQVLIGEAPMNVDLHGTYWEKLCANPCSAVSYKIRCRICEIQHSVQNSYNNNHQQGEESPCRPT
jgi:hypothetical protein